MGIQTTEEEEEEEEEEVEKNVRAPRLGPAHDLFVFRQGERRSGGVADRVGDEEARVGGRRSRSGAGKETGGEF